MPKFDVSTIGGELQYDFTTWIGAGSDHVGVVPEPSRSAVNALMKEVQRSFKDTGVVAETDDDSTTPSEIADRMNKIDDDELFQTMADKITDAVAGVCGGSPSLETLRALPYRPFMGFFGFLVGNLMNPEGSKSGTQNSPRRLTSA